MAKSKSQGFGTYWRFTETAAAADVGTGTGHPFGFKPSGLARIFYAIRTLTVATGITGAAVGTTSIPAGIFPAPTTRAALFGANYKHLLEVAGPPAGGFLAMPEGLFYDGLYYPAINYSSDWDGDGSISSENLFGYVAIGNFTFLGSTASLYGSNIVGGPSGSVTVTPATSW